MLLPDASTLLSSIVIDRMPSYSFSALEALPLISEPVEVLSIASELSEWDEKFQTWPADHLYKENSFSELPTLLTYLQGVSDFSLTAESGHDKLKFTSTSDTLNLRLSESSFFHNAYVSRYLKFSKEVPAKSSPLLDTFYVASASLEPKSKYFKDLSVLVTKVFSTCSISLLLKIEPPFQLTKVTTAYLKNEVATHSNLSPLQLTEIPPDESFEFYEYLCLLHMNSLPDTNNSHVQASSMYEFPGSEEEIIFNSLWLHVAKNVCPSVFESLISTDGWVTAFAKTENHNLVLKRTSKGFYIWHIHN